MIICGLDLILLVVTAPASSDQVFRQVCAPSAPASSSQQLPNAP
jgi:hypothetical protein